VAPTKLVWDSVNNIARGQRIDRALLDAANNQVEIFRAVAPIAQLGLSFIPGVGQGVSAAIGAGLALADGKPITDALIAGMKGAITGGPLVQRAVELGVNAVGNVAAGKRIDEIALSVLRSQLPGGDAARIAFDTGLALAGQEAPGGGSHGRGAPRSQLAAGTGRVRDDQARARGTAARGKHAVCEEAPRGQPPGATAPNGSAQRRVVQPVRVLAPMRAMTARAPVRRLGAVQERPMTGDRRPEKQNGLAPHRGAKPFS
jgi:hypothetical protein